MPSFLIRLRSVLGLRPRTVAAPRGPVITQFSHHGPDVTIKLEGELVGAWVDAVRDACTKRSRRSGRLRLDLAAVTYADAAGVQLLRDLVGEGIEIAACSILIAELLHPEGLRTQSGAAAARNCPRGDTDGAASFRNGDSSGGGV